MQRNDLRTLAESSQLDQARDERLALAEASCSRGIALIGLAESGGFQDRDLVMQGCHLLMDAIQYARQQIEPYLHLTRIFLVFQDDVRALKYLKSAQAIDPQHPDVLCYLEFLQGHQAADLDTLQPDFPSGATKGFAATLGLDPDVLYEQIEMGIFQEVKKLMRSELACGVAPDSEGARTFLANACRQLEETIEQIHSQLRLIDDEIDTSELVFKIRPLEVMLSRKRQALDRACELHAIEKRIVTLTCQARKLEQQSQPGKGNLDCEHLEKELDWLMDACDLIANQLDDLDQKKVDITALESHYEVLVAIITRIQDQLEDCPQDGSQTWAQAA